MEKPGPTRSREGTLPPASPDTSVPFGVNEIRLNLSQWMAVAILVVLAIFLIPRIWEKVEKFEVTPDYRLPYVLSKDYWLYGRRLRQLTESRQVVAIGDSVVWGEYVLPDGT